MLPSITPTKDDLQSSEVLPCVQRGNDRILSLYPVRSLFVRSSRCKPLRQVISSGSSDILLSRMSNTETDSKCCRCSAVILLIWLLPRWISCWSNKGYSLCLLMKTSSPALHQNEKHINISLVEWDRKWTCASTHKHTTISTHSSSCMGLKFFLFKIFHKDLTSMNHTDFAAPLGFCSWWGGAVLTAGCVWGITPPSGGGFQGLQGDVLIDCESHPDTSMLENEYKIK